jgi:hypothetical protein
MNRIITILLLLVLGAPVLAFRNEARLSVTSLGNTPIRVVLNGRILEDRNNTVYINNIFPGTHRIQIYSMRFNNRDRSPGRGNRSQGELIYNGTISARRGMITDIIISRFGRVFIDEQPVNEWWDDDRNNGGWNNGGWNNSGWNNGNGYPGGTSNGWGQPMNDQNFRQLKQMVQQETFDDRRLELLRSALPDNAVSSNQVLELMQILSFEKNKLELAKFAYRYTTDRNNYFLVQDGLLFSNSKAELSRYISSYRD